MCLKNKILPVAHLINLISLSLFKLQHIMYFILTFACIFLLVRGACVCFIVVILVSGSVYTYNYEYTTLGIFIFTEYSSLKSPSQNSEA